MLFDRVQFEEQAVAQIRACSDAAALECCRVKYLGRKGLIAEQMARIPTMEMGVRKEFGAAVNMAKQVIAQAIEDRQEQLANQGVAASTEALDVTLPGHRLPRGSWHPLTQVTHEICEVFAKFGFKVYEGPEIETEYHNFEALHIPLEHPSRDGFDTFYIHQKDSEKLKTKQRLLLRSHTSPAQIRAMKSARPPMAVLMPGRVYRPDAVDASHSFMFHQVEGIAIDRHIRFSDLKGVLLSFAREMFGSQAKLRFRPSFFPFTEPSAEVDVSCFLCEAKGCPVCKKSGWLEILGCGMIHPHVLRCGGHDPERWRGFAFGMGVERIAMLKFGIPDIRLFFENDIRFLEQF